ncbi:hypothetical protein [Saccharopolyspora sp. NPDC050642]|uniref:hypothetical protein n=1 Tax=Saccharopolyspora sp. NPDC050642 TaxID=3157099 RepID=UPI0033F50690
MQKIAPLLAQHHEGDLVRVSDFYTMIRRRGNGLIDVMDVLSMVGILLDDRPSVFGTWLKSTIDKLLDLIAGYVRRCAHVLREGGP